MSMAWTIVLALVAGSGGHHPPPALDQARPASERTIRPQASSPSHSLSVTRRSWHRVCSGCWSLANLEEIDTEEVDETWMVHLDVVASVPASWLRVAWSRAVSMPKVFDDSSLPPLSSFPLRC